MVIVDAPHLLAEDLKAYWASGQVRLASSSCSAALPRPVVVRLRLCVEGTLQQWLRGPLLVGSFAEHHLLHARAQHVCLGRHAPASCPLLPRQALLWSNAGAGPADVPHLASGPQEVTWTPCCPCLPLPLAVHATGCHQA